MYYGENDKSINEIFAEALVQIIRNQMELKKHLGIVRDINDTYGDCYSDHKAIDALQTIE